VAQVLIEDLSIGGGRVDFTDRRTKRAPTKVFAPIAFHLRQFRTTAEGGSAQLQARSQDGEALSWQGQVSLAPVASHGRFTLTGLQAKTVEDFVGELLPFRVPAGRVDLGGDYTFSLPKQGGMQLDARLPKIDVRDLRFRAQGVSEDWVVVPSAHVADTRMSLARRDLAIGALRADGVRIDAWREPNGDISLLRLFTGKVVEAAKSAPAARGMCRSRRARIEGAHLRLEGPHREARGGVRVGVAVGDRGRPEPGHDARAADHRHRDRQRQGTAQVGRHDRSGSVLRRPARRPCRACRCAAC
jgi:hypothetical protein